MTGGRRQYRFFIDGDWTPESLPMERLAGYMANLAVMLGAGDQLHFVGLEQGSAVLVQEVDIEAQAEVSERLKGIAENNAPKDAMKAFEGLKRWLAKDEASGRLVEGEARESAKGIVLDIPLKDLISEAKYDSIGEYSNLQGIVIAVGGASDPVPVRLQDREITHYCEAKRTVAKELAQHIFGPPLRVSGKGRWHRSSDGRWSMEKFEILEFIELDDAPLSHVRAELQEIAKKQKFPVDVLERLAMLRRDED